MRGVRAPGKCLQKDMEQRDEGSPRRGECGFSAINYTQGEGVGLPTYSASTSKPMQAGGREASLANVPQVPQGSGATCGNR